jgi:hypothetical protein
MRSRARINDPGAAFSFGSQGTALDPVPSDARCAAARWLGGFINEIHFDTTQSNRGRSKCLHDFTRERHRVQGRGPAEGAHPVRRCAPFSRSAHLGKSRRFLRRCAPVYKMRTENCAPSYVLTQKPRSPFDSQCRGPSDRFNRRSKIQNPKSFTLAAFGGSKPVCSRSGRTYRITPAGGDRG